MLSPKRVSSCKGVKEPNPKPGVTSQSGYFILPTHYRRARALILIARAILHSALSSLVHYFWVKTNKVGQNYYVTRLYV